MIQNECKESFNPIILRQNAQETLANISLKTGIPVSTLFEKIKNNKMDIIWKSTALIDFSKLGFHTRANICIKIDKKMRKSVGEFLKAHTNIHSMYKINNGYDYMIEGVL